MLADDSQIKTYRYLRVGMLLVILMLFAGIAIEFRNTGPGDRCLQTSISAYYYTPVRSVFVGALIAIGACLIIIRGYIDLEDIALNIAGMLAPIVAFVPSAGKGDCRSAALVRSDATADIGNGVGALFVVGLFAVVIAGVAVNSSYNRHSEATGGKKAGLKAKVFAQAAGLAVAGGIVIAALAWYELGRPSFERRAHYTAAISLFVMIGIVVQINAIKDRDKNLSLKRPTSWALGFRNRFGVITAAMILVPIGMLGYKLIFGWAHLILGVEAALILLFAAFWAIQTIDSRDSDYEPPTFAPPTGS